MTVAEKNYKIIIFTDDERKQKRVVDVSEDMFDDYFRDIDTYRRRQQRHRECVCPKSKRMMCDITPDAMTRKWRRFIDAHDLPDIRLHDLRHSNATALIQAGVNPRVVQQRLGHSDVNITLNTYTHVLPEMDEEAAAKLDSIVLHRA